MLRMSRFAVAPVLFAASAARAQNLADSAALTNTAPGDYAAAMIGFLFRGEPLPAAFPFGGAPLAVVGDALRGVLSAYSFMMLGLAVLLVFYQVIRIVADTAHHGVFMGRRGSQIWAPLRLVVAILLLVPAGSGSSLGQRLVLRVATMGSNLASHAWNESAEAFGVNFFMLAPPRGPDLSRFALTAVEMESCRDIYDQAVSQAGAQSNTTMRLAGTIADLQKMPANAAAPETWRYANLINAAEPMCGEYRFPGLRKHPAGAPLSPDIVSRVADGAAGFAHGSADSVIEQARLTAGQDAPSFYTSEIGAVPPSRADLAGLRQGLRQDVDSHMRSLAAAQASVAGKYLAQLDRAGWIGAGFFIPDLMRAQTSYGQIADHILPDIQEPVFVHRGLTQQVLSDAIGLEPALRGLDHETLDGLYRFYAALSRSNARMHDWLYGDDDGGFGPVPATAFDLRDRLTSASDASAAFAAFAQTMDAAAQNRGVWGETAAMADGGNPFAAVGPRDRYNPVTALIEFGRRQIGLGASIVGLASGIVAQPQIMIPAILAALAGGVLMLGGAGLVFLAPLLPLARFLWAILAWLVELVEALAAVPLAALAHLSLSGDGIAGSAARQSYMLWIALAIRPVLTLAGLMAGVVIFALGLSFLMLAFAPLAQLAAGDGGGMLVAAHIGITLAYDILACLIAWAAFKGINLFPDRALRWLSVFVMTDLPADNAHPAVATGPSGAPGGVAVITQQAGPRGPEGGAARASSPAPTPAAGRMTGLFPTTGQKDAVSPASPPVAGKIYTTAPGTVPPALASSASFSQPAIGERNVQMVISKDKKDAKDQKTLPHGEEPFFAQKADGGEKPRESKPQDGTSSDKPE